MSAKYDVAVVGASGAVGETMLEILGERDFPVNKVYLLASARSAGKRLPFKDTHLKVEDLDSFDFSKVQIGLFSAGASISAKYAPIAAEAIHLMCARTYGCTDIYSVDRRIIYFAPQFHNFC